MDTIGSGMMGPVSFLIQRRKVERWLAKVGLCLDQSLRNKGGYYMYDFGCNKRTHGWRQDKGRMSCLSTWYGTKQWLLTCGEWKTLLLFLHWVKFVTRVKLRQYSIDFSCAHKQNQCRIIMHQLVKNQLVLQPYPRFLW